MTAVSEVLCLPASKNHMVLNGTNDEKIISADINPKLITLDFYKNQTSGGEVTKNIKNIKNC